MVPSFKTMSLLCGEHTSLVINATNTNTETFICFELSCTVNKVRAQGHSWMCSKYELQELIVTYRVQGQAVGRPAAVKGRFGLAV